MKEEELKFKSLKNISQEDLSLLKGKHVLLAEDDPLNQDIAKTLLEEAGMIVSVSENGELAVKSFSESPISYYDVVLMDIRMPVMDGYQATEAIKALNRLDAKTVPIIAMTANAFDDDIKRCIDMGMTAHIMKPIDIDLMYATIVNALSDRK